MKVSKVEGSFGTVELGGVERRVSLQLLDPVEVGDFVLIHAGFAIQKLDEEKAKETLSILKEIAT